MGQVQKVTRTESTGSLAKDDCRVVPAGLGSWVPTGLGCQVPAGWPKTAQASTDTSNSWLGTYLSLVGGEPVHSAWKYLLGCIFANWEKFDPESLEVLLQHNLASL